MAKKKVVVEKVDKQSLSLRDEGRNDEVMLEELLESGAHFGHRSDRWNPKIAPYVFGVREGVHIFDLEKTRDYLIVACRELTRRAALGETILLVGTKPQAKLVIVDIAKKTGMPYVSEHWIGGTLTNFGQIKKSVDQLHTMKKDREAGDFKKYTKKEQLLMDRKITKLEKIFGGVAQMPGLPDAIFIVDLIRERTAVAEGIRAGIPLFAIVDTNADPTLIDFPIPANDDSVKAVEYVVGKVGNAIEEGLVQKAANADKPQPSQL